MTETTPKRRRARKPDGRFQANDPNTEINEAWEPIPMDEGLPKKDYSVKQKINTASNTAGKYARKPKTRPTFGKVTTTYN